MKITFAPAPKSLSRIRPPQRAIITVAALQFSWKEDPAQHAEQIEQAVKQAKAKGAQIIAIQLMSAQLRCQIKQRKNSRMDQPQHC
jgi:hypothetical protein